MFDLIKKCVMVVLDPPWEKDGPDTFTLAVPEAHSTFKIGDVGWAKRPPAVVRCSSCNDTFLHALANDIIDCPTCRFQCSPDEFDQVELVGLVCPHCQHKLDHGIRHPMLVDVPEWASCEECQYHWEYLHHYSR